MQFVIAAISVFFASNLFANETWYVTHPSICESPSSPGYRVCQHQEDFTLVFPGRSRRDAELECLKAALSLGLKDECFVISE